MSYGRPVKEGHSGIRLAATTLADEMRMQLWPRPRVVSFSMKARLAIGLAGHGGDIVTWFDDGVDSWMTSSVYSATPVPSVAAFIASHPVEQDFGKTWSRSLPDGSYKFEDVATGKTPPGGWGPSFPHELHGTSSTPDASFYDQWLTSPFADEYLARMAAANVDALKLGRSGRTDFLAVSFSALDRVGHNFGPLSHEVQDTLLRLDATLGRLFDDLDWLVGAGRFVVALSADHGIGPVPEQMKAMGLDAGRVNTKEILSRVDETLAARIGPGKYVARMYYTDFYFAPGVYDKLKLQPEALDFAVATIRATPGIRRVYRGDELARGAYTDDGTAHAAALSYYPGRSGDLIVVPRPVLDCIIERGDAWHRQRLRLARPGAADGAVDQAGPVSGTRQSDGHRPDAGVPHRRDAGTPVGSRPHGVPDVVRADAGTNGRALTG